MTDIVSSSFAALERAKSIRSQHYEPCLPESYAPLNEYTKNVLMANARFTQQCIDSRVRYILDDKHVCDPGCSRMQFNDAFICQRRGHLHYCDSQRCDERREYSMDASGVSVTMYTEDTCMFSGKRYGTVFEEQIDDRQGSMSQFIVETIKIKKPKPPKSTEPRAPRVRSKTGVKGRKLAKATIDKQQNQDVLFVQARSHLLSMFPEAKRNQVPENLSNRFATTCVRLWVKVHVAAEKIYRALKYRFNYHCYVIMYYMQEGFSSGDLFILPSNDFLARHLPSMKDLDQFNIKTKWHTKCSRQFLVAVQQLPRQELVELSAQVRAIWA